MKLKRIGYVIFVKKGEAKMYSVWFTDLRYKIKYITNKRKAVRFCNLQKAETFVNNNIYTDNEDTIYCNGKKTVGVK